MPISSCPLSTCICHKRCFKCDNFVDKGEALCIDCKIGVCQNCFRTNEKLYVSQIKQGDNKFGFNFVRKAVCNYCYSESYKVCPDCSEKFLIKAGHKCGGKEVCKECSTPLDGSGYCYVCRTSNAPVCLTCSKPLKATSRFCHIHSNNCINCHTIIVTNDKLNLLCDYCKDIMDAEMCTLCNRAIYGGVEPLVDYRGYCSSCSEANERHICKLCGMRETTSPLMPCEECAKQIDECPRCSSKKMKRHKVCKTCYGTKNSGNQ